MRDDGDGVVGDVSGQDLAGILQRHVDGAEGLHRPAGNLAGDLHLDKMLGKEWFNVGKVLWGFISKKERERKM